MAIIAPRFSYERLRAVALAFLKQHHRSGELPVPIEHIVELKLKLDIVPVHGLQEEFDVDAFITNDLREIRVDEFVQQQRNHRYRFSLAHEVSHLIIHRDLFRQLAFSTIEEWKKSMNSIPADAYRWIEWQANSLGGLLLVPGVPLKGLFEDKVAQARNAKVRIGDLGDSEKKIVESGLTRYFVVSQEVIARRMEYDKLWK